MLKFDWDDGNRNHFRKHGVSPEEAEQVILNGPVDVEWQQQDDEERFVQIGQTNSGRVLMVASTVRAEKTRIITAFEPPKGLLKAYLSKRKGLHE